MKWCDLATAAAAALLWAGCGGAPEEPKGVVDSGAAGRAGAGQGGTGGAAAREDAGGAAGDTGGPPDAGGTGAGGTGAGDTGAGDTGADGGCTALAPRFATRVVATSFGPGQSFGRELLPEVVLGPPRGGGCCAGSTDVCSLGHGGWIVLEAEGNAIVDGPGADLVVFENPFWIGGDETRPYVEPGRVSVSDDGVTWYSFDCSAAAAPYAGCAGVSPVHANPDTGGPDPLDPARSGGDAFDLSTLGLPRARYVRIEDVDTDSAVFDLDAIALVNAECP